MSKYGRRRSSGVVDAEYECEDCGVTSNSRKNALANAARHHDATGHYVRAYQTIVVMYGTEKKERGEEENKTR